MLAGCTGQISFPQRGRMLFTPPPSLLHVPFEVEGSDAPGWCGHIQEVARGPYGYGSGCSRSPFGHFPFAEALQPRHGLSPLLSSAPAPLVLPYQTPALGAGTAWMSQTTLVSILSASGARNWRALTCCFFLQRFVK